jgi:hypothetical protein
VSESVPERVSESAPESVAEDGGALATDISTNSALQDIWHEMLGHPAGPHDDFFAMGGDSLLAVQVLARINRQFAIELPIDVFFESDFTIAGLTAVIENALKHRTPVGQP